MSRLIHQAADKLFKQTMADARVAKEFLEIMLPWLEKLAAQAGDKVAKTVLQLRS